MMAEQHDERRRSYREARHERLFVQVALPVAGTGQDDEPVTVFAATRNVSSTGLCLRAAQYFEPGSQLDCWVRVTGLEGTFFLLGAVRWVTEVEDGRGYLFGVELLPAPYTDYPRWSRLFATTNAAVST